jgi:hypothetical protein
MQIITVKLVKNSLCECGHPLLDESIPLGTEYRADRDSIRQDGWGFVCGGCQRVHYNLRTIDVSSALNPSAPLKPLPVEIFDLGASHA